MSNGCLVASSGIMSTSKVSCSWGGHVRDVKRKETKDYQFATAANQNVLMWQLDPHQGTVKFTKANTGGLIREYTVVIYSTDGDYLYLGTASGEFACVHVRTNMLHSTFSVCAQGVQSMIISNSDDKLLIGGGDGTVTMFKGKGKDFVDSKKKNLTGAVTSLSFGPDCETFIAATTDGDVYRCITNTLSSQLHTQNHKGPVLALAYLPDVNEKFATISEDNTVRYWDVTDYGVKAKAEFKTTAKPQCLCFISDVILTGWSDGSIRSVDSETGEVLWNIAKAHRAPITCIKAGNNKKFFVSGDQDGEVRVWEVKTKELVNQFKEHIGAITDLHIHKDDSHIFSSSRDKSIFVWDLKRQKRVSAHFQKMGAINSMAVTNDHLQILSVGSNKQIVQWDVRQPDPVYQFAYTKSNAFEPKCIQLSHSNEYFAVGGTDENINLFTYHNMNLVQVGEGHSGTVHDLKFCPDDKQIVSVGNDGCIFVWNIFQS